MIPGVTPVAAVPLGSTFVGLSPPATVSPPPIQTQTAEHGVWLADIIVLPTSLSGPPPVTALPLAMVPVAAPDRPGAVVATTQPVLRVSDRGWIGEPSDSMAPNASYASRMIEPPALEAALPLYPDADRRLAVSVGELRLANSDGALDRLAGDWTVAGRAVTLRRGPHRRPLHAPFTEMVTVATLRAAAAAMGTDTLSLPLRPAAADLDASVCPLYAGSGGAEGPSSLGGQTKPLLLGRKYNVEPVLVDPGLLLYQLHAGPMLAIDAVRDRGVPLGFAGNQASAAALNGAMVAAGTYQTCLAAGLFRIGSAPSLITVDAQGDNAADTGGYNTGSAASIARKLLARGVIGFDVTRWAWPVGECGLALRGGTIAQALNAIAGGVFGWWGSDAGGVWQGGQLTAPESQPIELYIEPWMVAAPPEEIGTPRAPWYRARVAARVLGRTQEGEQLAGAVTATNREFYSRASTLATAYDATASLAYPLAEDGPVLLSAFDLVADAQSLAEQILALTKRPRRLFQVRMRPGAAGYAWPTLRLGACVSLRWPQRQALASGRALIVTGISARGDSTTLSLWG
jgi:hypothetical protein